MYEDLGKQPNIVKSPIGTSINHFFYLVDYGDVCTKYANPVRTPTKHMDFDILNNLQPGTSSNADSPTLKQVIEI